MLSAISILAYLNTLGHGFVLDDIAVIEQNKFVHEGVNGLGQIFTTFYWKGFWDTNANLYRPLSLVMFALEWQLMPNQPFIHHLVQVILYGFTMVMLIRVLTLLLPQYHKWLISIIVLLFALHPMHTEVVANIKSRDEILSFLFLLLTLYLLLKQPNPAKTYLAYVTFLFALLSKEASITYLAVILGTFMLLMQYSFKKSLIRLLPFLGISAIWLSWHYYVTHILAQPALAYTYADNSLVACPTTIERICTGLTIFGLYLWKAIWPFQFSYDYSFNAIPCANITTPSVWFSLTALLGLLVTAFYYYRKNKLISFSILFFLSTLSISTNLLLLIGTTFAERLLFTPLLGLILLLVAILPERLKTTANIKSVPVVLGLFVAALFMVTTFNRNKAWKSNESLYTTDGQKENGSARTLYNYATILLGHNQQEELPKVISLLTRTIDIDPGYPQAYVNLGTALYRTGNYQEAINRFKQALNFSAKDNGIRHNLGDAYVMNKQYDSALTCYTRCEADSAIQPHTYKFMGTCYFSLQQFDKALAAFAKGIKRNADDAELWVNYGNALAVLKQYENALNAFNKALNLNPGDKKPLYFMSMVYRDMGNIAQSDTCLARYNKQP